MMVVIMAGAAMGGMIGMRGISIGTSIGGATIASGTTESTVNGNKVVRQHGCEEKQVDLPGFAASIGCLVDPLTRKCCLVRKSIGTYRLLVVAAEAANKRAEQRRERRIGAI